MTRIWFSVALLGASLGIACANSHTANGDDLPPAAGGKIDFVKQIEPILRASCLSCHGPEEEEGGLRIDLQDRLLAGGDSGKVVAPGASAKSRLIHLIAGTDDDLGIMPPEGEGTPLSPEQIGLLRAWIDEGAKWPDGAFADAQVKGANHWAFQPIQRSKLPTPHNATWVRNPIDAFVLRQLESKSIEPSPETDKNTLIRRLYLDLVGLPPTPAEVTSFIADDRENAYELLVDRLLDSPHYGERWARHWLDMARYADTDGYEKDRPRPHAWRYREWVIQALNDDLPFDEFTIQQIAGDMLPSAEGGDPIATGFHRNTLHNTEGGADPEEDRVKKTVDRTNTVGAIWLGMTVGCAQCHSHKYDPFTQREYFSLYGFFNSLDEREVNVPATKDLTEIESAHAQKTAALRAAITTYETESLAVAQKKWEATFDSKRAAWQTLSATKMTSKHGATLQTKDDGSLLVNGRNEQSDVYTIQSPVDVPRIAAIRLEVLPDASLVAGGPGRADNGNFVLANLDVSLQQSGKKSIALKLKSVTATHSQSDWPAAAILDKSLGKGWAISPRMGEASVAKFLLDQPVDIPSGAHLSVTLDQHYDRNPHNLGHFRLSVAESADVAMLEAATIAKIAELLKVSADARTPAAAKQLAQIYRDLDPQLQRLNDQLKAHLANAPKPAPAGKARAVVQRSAPRKTRVHIRGNFLDPGEEVAVNTPAVLPRIVPRGAQPDRLDFAHWLVDEKNPLTARVTVNRIWSRYFGRGIVNTVDDFGLQGDTPSHPRLLDWLASELIDGGWSLKHVHKLIVMSATYRQSSAQRDDLEEIDPENILLARQTRRRVSAEIVRDVALATSGLLNRRVGGPSVRPPQPAEYSSLTYANSAKWKTSAGGDAYRRGLYTFFQRTSPYPMLMTFDAPDSNQCAAERMTSNTPLQALTVWNDPVFFECAQALGRRIVEEQTAGANSKAVSTRSKRAFLLCLSREPSDVELAALNELYLKQLVLTMNDPKAVTKIIGDQPLPNNVKPADLAAWIMVGRTLMNLDEFLTKE